MRVYGDTIDLFLVHLEESLLVGLHVIEGDGSVAKGGVDELRLSLGKGHIEDCIGLFDDFLRDESLFSLEVLQNGGGALADDAEVVSSSYREQLVIERRELYTQSRLILSQLIHI